MKVYLDFETASECDLWATNASVYSNHPSTEILCAVFRTDCGQEWVITDFRKPAPPIVNFLSVFTAHTAIFEQLIWQNIMVKRYGYRPLSPDKWRCTRAKGQACSLPGSLEKLADALNLVQQKDMAGKKLMLKMCKPDGPRDAESMAQLIKYCRQDVLTTIAIDKVLPDLSPFEQKVWELDQEINLRGVRIDIPLVEEITELLNAEKERLAARFGLFVQGKVNSPNCAVALRKFLTDSGYPCASTDAAEIKRLLALPDLPDAIREILEIRKIMAKSSTAKYQKMREATDADGRLRENLVYHGASTGRWTGQGVQLQNLPRPKFDVSYALGSIPTAEISWPVEYGSINYTASSLVRSMIIPDPGKVLIGGDYAGIEARITPWIAGQKETLDIFRRGEDIYCTEATRTFDRTVTKDDKDERQVGKCQVLGLGYQGGIAAFYKMCTIYSVSLAPIAQTILASATEDEMHKADFAYASYKKDAVRQGLDHFNETEGKCADILKQRWRGRNKKIVEFWVDVEHLAKKAVGYPRIRIANIECNEDLMMEEAINQKRRAEHQDLEARIKLKNYALSWEMDGDFLLCILPSGRPLYYYKPEIRMVKNKFGTVKETLTYLAVDSKTKQLMRESTYGGKLTENIVQAIARDVMVEGMFNVKNYGLDLALTVHDELLSEGKKETNLAEVEECFTRQISWAKDLPLAAEVWKGERYRK